LTCQLNLRSLVIDHEAFAGDELVLERMIWACSQATTSPRSSFDIEDLAFASNGDLVVDIFTY
jgi:hypothetical protein